MEDVGRSFILGCRVVCCRSKGVAGLVEVDGVPCSDFPASDVRCFLRHHEIFFERHSLILFYLFFILVF